MGNTYNRGDTFVKYLNVLRMNGTVPDGSEYTTPTYSVYFKNGAFAILVANAAMTQGSGNVWYFRYTISVTADLGDYLVKYKTTINGAAVEATDDYSVGVVVNPGPGTGEFEITDIVESDALEELDGVDIYAFLPADTTSAIAHDTTDVDGEFTLHLDAGTYEVLFSKSGYISETHTLTVNPDGTFSWSGN